MLPVRTGTVIMLLVALLFGGLAVFIAKVWLANQQVQISRQVAPEPVQVETQKIVVAKKELHFGEAITPEVVSEIAWPKEALPEGAFASIADISKDGNRVVLTPIGLNEPILAWKISGPGSRASLSALVKEGMRAVTIRVNDTTGVAGFVLPGDRVDVLYTVEGGPQGTSIDVLFQNVRILAINQNVDEKTGNPIDGRTATLELTPVDAQKLALAQSTGGLTFTLRSAGSLDTAPARRVVQGELGSTAAMSQSDDAKSQAQTDLENRLAELEAKLKQGQSSTAQPVATDATSEDALPSTVQITIFRGLQGSSYTVPLDANQ